MYYSSIVKLMKLSNQVPIECITLCIVQLMYLSLYSLYLAFKK